MLQKLIDLRIQGGMLMKKYLIAAGLLVMCGISFAENERLCARGMDGNQANANVDANGVWHRP